MLLCFSISNASLRSPSTSFGLVKLTEGRFFFFFSSRRRHTRWNCDWSSDVCSSDLGEPVQQHRGVVVLDPAVGVEDHRRAAAAVVEQLVDVEGGHDLGIAGLEQVAAEDGLDLPGVDRSEERRVGKECRARRWTGYES